MLAGDSTDDSQSTLFTNKTFDWTTDRYKKREERMSQDIDTLQEKNTAIAIALSVLWTGAGHLYVGKENKGAILLIIYIVLVILAVATGGVFLVALFPFWIWGIFDASKVVDEHNSQLKKAKEERQAEQKKAQAEQEKIRKETTNTSEFVEQIEKLSKLHSANFLSEDEYKAKKKDLILSLLDKKPQDDPIDFFAALVPSIEKGYLTEEEISQIKKFVE